MCKPADRREPAMQPRAGMLLTIGIGESGVERSLATLADHTFYASYGALRDEKHRLSPFVSLFSKTHHVRLPSEWSAAETILAFDVGEEL